MDFEDLIPILVFFLFAITSILKNLGKKKQAPVKEKKKKTSVLGKLADTIKNELERAAKEAQLKDQQAPVDDFSGLEMVEDVDKLDFYESASTYPEPKVIKVKKPASKPKRPVTRKKYIHEPVKQYRKAKFNKKQLRNAVVMSEILAPPVSMREG